MTNVIDEIEGDAYSDYTCRFCQKGGFSNNSLNYHIANNCDEAPKNARRDARRRMNEGMLR